MSGQMQALCRFVEAGAALTLGAAAHCGGSAATAAPRQFPSALALFNNHALAAGPEV